MKRLGLGDAKAIENLKKRLEEAAQGEEWKLDVVDTAHGREYRGIVGSDNEEGEPEKKKNTKESDDSKGNQKKEKKSKQKKKESQKGSEEEYYKEEL